MTCNDGDDGLYRFEVRNADESMSLRVGIQAPARDLEIVYPDLGGTYVELGPTGGTLLGTDTGDVVTSATIAISGFTESRAINGTVDIEWATSADDAAPIADASGDFSIVCGPND